MPRARAGAFSSGVSSMFLSKIITIKKVMLHEFMKSTGIDRFFPVCFAQTGKNSLSSVPVGRHFERHLRPSSNSCRERLIFLFSPPDLQLCITLTLLVWCLGILKSCNCTMISFPSQCTRRHNYSSTAEKLQSTLLLLISGRAVVTVTRVLNSVISANSPNYAAY